MLMNPYGHKSGGTNVKIHCSNISVDQKPIHNLCLIRSHGQGQAPMFGNETELVDAL